MTIKYFGKVAELVKLSSEEWKIEELSITDFKNELVKKYPFLKTQTIQIAVNKKLEIDTCFLKNSDEIAILPPFAGG